MSSTPSNPPARKSFMRLSQGHKHVSELVKEAKRVGYQVKQNGGPRIADTFNLSVHDHSPEAVTPGAEVFRAVQVRPAVWAVSYSTSYWQEPA